MSSSNGVTLALPRLAQGVATATSNPARGSPTPVQGGEASPPNGQALAASASASTELQPAKLDGKVAKLNTYVQQLHREVRFTVDKSTGITVIKVIDMSTHKVLRQIPAADVLAFAEYIMEGRKGALVSTHG